MRIPPWSLKLARVSGLYLGLVLLVWLMNWPWPLHFGSGLTRHWDPPFHAWKLRYVAEQIQQGHVLPPDGNSNCFFPSSRTLYYEALHWPQALVAAGLMGFTDNPILQYHLVMLLFWAFSGVCFYGLLRELAARRATAALGAVLFCVMPYRVSYFVEFNMQLVSGVVLFLLFGVRFFRRPGFWPGLGLGLAFWFQAASELYQAIILVFTAPLIFLPLLVPRLPFVWRDRRMLAGLLGFLLTVPLTLYFLQGYRDLHAQEAFHRSASDMVRHRLEPLSYLVRPDGSSLLPSLRVHRDEMSAYLTLPVLLAAACYFWYARRRPARAAADVPPAVPEPPPEDPCALLLHRLRLAALLGTAGLILLFEYGHLASAHASGRLLNAALLAALAVCVAASLRPLRRDDTSRVLAGLGAAALLAFVFSLSPVISLDQSRWQTPNLLLHWAYEHLPMLEAMRVISRFCVITLLYVVVIATLGWEAWASRRPRWLAALSAGLLVAGVLYESRPWGRPFDPIDWNPRSPVLARLAPPDASTLLVVPFGERYYDARHMLAHGLQDRCLLYGWGGFYPAYQDQLVQAYQTNSLDRFAAVLEEVWPPAQVLVARRPLPYNPAGVKVQKHAEAAQRLAAQFPVVAEDDDFALLRVPSTAGPVTVCARQTRADVLRQNPRVVFHARAASGTVRLAVLVNGAWFGETALDETRRTFSFVIPESWRNAIQPNRVQLRSLDDRPWQVGEFGFAPDETRLPADTTRIEPSARLPEPWPARLNHRPALPPGATPVSVRFANGLELCGYEAGSAPVRRGGAVPIRFYWSCPAARGLAGRPVMFVHAKQNSHVQFQCDRVILEDIPELELRFAPYRKIYTSVSMLQVPAEAAAGPRELWVGLVDDRPRRVPGVSALKQDHDAFRLPLTLEVAD